MHIENDRRLAVIPAADAASFRARRQPVATSRNMTGAPIAPGDDDVFILAAPTESGRWRRACRIAARRRANPWRPRRSRAAMARRRSSMPIRLAASRAEIGLNAHGGAHAALAPTRGRRRRLPTGAARSACRRDRSTRASVAVCERNVSVTIGVSAGLTFA